MTSLVAQTSLKRSPRTRTRKASICTRQKSRPLPLQIIPELSENEFEISPPPSPTPTRSSLALPTDSQPPKSSPRITLSAYTFSIDDALLMLGDEAPRSPALSASSSTSGSASSEEVPPTPGASDDEDYLKLPSPRMHSRRVTIRPLCIHKPRSFMCLTEEEELDELLEKESTPHVSSFPETQPTECLDSTREGPVTEDDYDFYAREFQDFISFYSEGCSPATSRPDSIILSAEAAPHICEPPEEKPRARSRFSKPLPPPPLPTPPLSTFPSVPTFPLVQTTAQSSFIRRKRNIPPLPSYPPPPPPAVTARPPPRMSIPADIADSDLVDDLRASSKPPIVIEQVWFDDEEDDAAIYVESFASPERASTTALSPAIPETPQNGVYDASLPRKSTDSDAPRSSVDSYSSSQSSEACSPISPFSFPSTPSSSSHAHDEEYQSPSAALRSRWSTSTLGSLAVEPTRTSTAALLSPLKTVFGGRSRRLGNPSTNAKSSPVPLSTGVPFTRSRMHIRTPSKLPASSHGFPTTPSPPHTPDRHIRRRGSRSSTSSTGTSNWSECDSFDSSGSPESGLRRKPIPVEMFLRA
ncbi:hypothetical protein ID866_4582 [Astraeus odoratus]|nr:hypothetical protein ID866_4582 [Astraeus odoratus]